MTTAKLNTAIADLHAAGAHLVICHPTNKRPVWPPPYGKDWQSTPAPLNAVIHAELCGLIPASIGLVVVDVDVDKNASEDERIIEAAAKSDAVRESAGPPLLEIESPSKGIHLYYRCNDEVGNAKWTMPDGEKGGELRGNAGFVCLYDPDALVVALENADDYDPVDLTKWPFRQDAPASTASGAPPKFTVDKVNELLNYISPDCDYEDWLRVGMALHHGGYSVSLWERWSARRGDEHRNTSNDCAQKWQGFGRKTGKLTTMGTLVNLAKAQGWTPPARHGGTRQGAGRPEKDGGADADRIIEEHADHLVSVFNGGVYARNSRGLLTPLSRKNEDSLTEVDRLLKACGDDRTHGTRHLNEVLGSLRAAAANSESVLHVAASDLDRRIPVLPTATGGYDLRTGHKVTSANMAIHLQTERGYLFTPPPSDMPDSAAGEVVLRLWEYRLRDIGRRIACHLLNARPIIDVVIGESGAGKGTLISLTRRAFPGMIFRAGIQKAMGSQGRKWSVVEDALTDSLIVFIDEADKEPDRPIEAGQVNGWIDGDQDVEGKGEKFRGGARRGTVMLIGGDFPPLPLHIQGMARRFTVVYEIPLTGEFSSFEWFQINDNAERQDLEDSAAMWRWLIVQECRKLAQEQDALEATETPESLWKCSEMFQARQPAEVQIIMQSLLPNNKGGGFVSTDALKGIFTSAGLKYNHKQIAMWLKIAFPDAKIVSGRPMVDGKRESGWHGVHLIT